MLEIWRNVVGYEGLYQVSNFGRVKSLVRVDRFGRRVPERILKPAKDKDGYLLVALWKDGKGKTSKVHRLVAEAFPDLVDWIEKVKGKPFEELVVNHKDQNKQNNHVSNLEWCDGPYNREYGDARERAAKTKTNGKCSKCVAQKTKDGKLVREWPSIAEVHRQTGWSSGTISKCCTGKRNSAYGFQWSYIKDFLLFKSDNSNLTSFPN